MNNRDPAQRAQPVRGVGSPVTVRDIGRDPEALDVFYRQHERPAPYGGIEGRAPLDDDATERIAERRFGPSER